MRYKYITKIEIKFDKKKTFKRKSIKYLQNYIFQESVKLPVGQFVTKISSIILTFSMLDYIYYKDDIEYSSLVA